MRDETTVRTEPRRVLELSERHWGKIFMMCVCAAKKGSPECRGNCSSERKVNVSPSTARDPD